MRRSIARSETDDSSDSGLRADDLVKRLLFPLSFRVGAEGARGDRLLIRTPSPHVETTTRVLERHDIAPTRHHAQALCGDARYPFKIISQPKTFLRVSRLLLNSITLYSSSCVEQSATPHHARWSPLRRLAL